jgi:hypothetical protein
VTSPATRLAPCLRDVVVTLIASGRVPGAYVADVIETLRAACEAAEGRAAGVPGEQGAKCGAMPCDAMRTAKP